MGSREYWQRRSEDIAQAQYDKADVFLEEMVSAYDRAMANITKEIEVFYARYAQNNEISYSEAVKKLTPAELKLFRMTLDEFIAKAKDNEDGRWTKELNNVYYKTRISRLDALYTQIQHHIEMITNSTVAGTSAMLNDTYEETYYRNIHSIQTGLGFGVNFGKLDKDKVNAATTERWLGGNYSSRIWEDKDALVRGLQTTIPQALIRGEALKRTVEIALGKLQGSEYNVRRIIKTEQSYLVHKATASGYAASDVVQEYEFLATLDKKTSEICRGTDKQVFNLKDLRVGVNYPPLHPNCRSTVTPYFEGNVTKRIARGADGKTYDVPGDMGYAEWRRTYVESNLEAVLSEKMYKNKAADEKQFTNYKSVLGKDAPKDISAFQQMKYTESKTYDDLKSAYQYISQRPGSNINDFREYKKSNIKTSSLQSQLRYEIDGKNGFIPTETRIKSIKIIAGKYTNESIRIVDRLVEQYGGDKTDWSKRVGKIESSKYYFDVHWYENNGIQYEMKVKHRGDK